MTSGNVSDEPIAYRDDDARERLARDRRPLPAPRPPDPHAHRRLGRARRRRPAAACCAARAGTCPRALRAPARPPRALLACGAELKSTFCVAKGARAWVGHHIGDLRNERDAAVVRRGHRALRAAVRGRAGGRRPRPAPRLPLDDLRARARGRRARRRPAPPRPPRRRAWPSTASAARPSGRSTTAPGSAPTGRCGAASCSVGDLRGFERAGAPVAGAAARRRPRGAPAVADGLRVAGRGRATPSRAAAVPRDRSRATLARGRGARAHAASPRR